MIIRSKKLALVASVAIALCSAGCADWQNPFAPKSAAKPAAKPAKSVETESPPAPAVQPINEPVPEPKNGQLASDLPEDGPTMRSLHDYVSQLNAAKEAGPASTMSAVGETPPPDATAEPAPKKTVIPPNPKPALAAAPAAEPMEAPHDVKPRAKPATAAAPEVRAVGLIGDTKLAAPTPQDTIGLNRGLDASAPENDATLDRLIEQANTELRAAPSDADRQWRLSLLQLAAGRTQDALTLSPALSSEAKARLTQTLKTMIAAGKLHTDPGAAPDDVLAAVDELGGTLRKESELRVPIVALCKKVVTFGVYEELPKNALVPNRANRVIVYCEIENFASQKQNDGEFKTMLSSRMELFTAEGKSVWVAEEDKIEDRSRQKRQDFFLAQLVTLPADLAAGNYVMKVAITDLIAGKTNEGVLKFRIGS
jgi:hypothetical protein